MNTEQKLSRRPWWMINGAREPLGDVNTDYLDGERFRWGMTEEKETERKETNTLNESIPK